MLSFRPIPLQCTFSFLFTILNKASTICVMPTKWGQYRLGCAAGKPGVQLSGICDVICICGAPSGALGTPIVKDKFCRLHLARAAGCHDGPTDGDMWCPLHPGCQTASQPTRRSMTGMRKNAAERTSLNCHIQLARQLPMQIPIPEYMEPSSAQATTRIANVAATRQPAPAQPRAWPRPASRPTSQPASQPTSQPASKPTIQQDSIKSCGGPH